jgi:lipopolysaccharide transport system ATP-binding protein
LGEIAIQVEDLGKRYRLGSTVQSYFTFREALVGAARAPIRVGERLVRRSPAVGEPGHRPDFWALRNLSFDVPRGEVLGIIGRNGAGKSTLLKLLSRITEPTLGRIRIFGRVSSLLEVGTGFHPELTGRENVFLNGAILGMSRGEIQRKFDEIVAFAEVEKFIDTQVKFYSSGMYLRLAFSVAAHLEPDILIVDEVLAVGDASFQRKCLGKLHDITSSQRTVIFVSHQMAAVESLCSEVMVLERGAKVFYGKTNEGIARYLQSVEDVLTEKALGDRTDRSGTNRVRLTHFHVEDERGNPLAVAMSGQTIDLVLSFEAAADARLVDVGLSISDEGDRLLTVIYAGYAEQVFPTVPRQGQFRCRIAKLPLTPKRYFIGARVIENGVEADWPANGIGFLDVEGGDFYGTGSAGFGSAAVFFQDAAWQVQG